MKEEQRRDFSSGRGLQRGIDPLFQVVHCNADVLMAAGGNRERPDKVNAHNMKRFFRSRDIMLETRIRSFGAFKHNTRV